MSSSRGQTGLEYLLMIAGGVLISAIVMAVVSNNLNTAAGSVNSSEYSSHIQNYLSSGPAGYTDGDWIVVGNDQYSGVPGNVGIGITNPQAKLEVNGKILMDSETTSSDAAATVATKSYVDAGLAVKQALMTGNCSVGSYITAIAANGTVTCGAAANSWNTSGSNQYSGVSGNVGIGVSAPSQKLEVSGIAKATDVCVDSGCLNALYQTVNTVINPELFGHSTTQRHGVNCTNAGGNPVYVSAGIVICQIQAEVCPSGWLQYLSYSATTGGTKSCCTGEGACRAWCMPGTVSGHSWQNAGIESNSVCTCQSNTQACMDSCSIYATVSAIGCY